MGLASMFNRLFSTEPETSFLWLRFTTTTAGAVGTYIRRKGFGWRTTAPAVRNSAGNYTITLSDQWPQNSELFVSATPSGGGAFAPAGVNGNAAIVSVDAYATPPTIVIQFQDATGAAADVRNGASVMVAVGIKRINA